MANLDALIEEIRSRELWPGVFNPWAHSDALDVHDNMGLNGPTARVQRLRQHFDCPNPRLLLIGEAPGYAGCHFSGVAFTNERLVLEGLVPRVRAEGRITSRLRPWSEPAATIMWETLHAGRMAEHTVMWNAFPYHPHLMATLRSNRAPTEDELLSCRPILHSVLLHFRGCMVVAVGQVAHRALDRLGVKHDTVRHPSMGGATTFREQMRSFYVPF